MGEQDCCSSPTMNAANMHALVPAAGIGKRMSSSSRDAVPKQYLRLAGKPILAHAVEALAAHPAISGVTVAVAPSDERFEALEFASTVAVEQVVGGPSRAQSVLNGLEHVRATSPAEWVVVHDAVRPCISRRSLDRLLREGVANPDGAILAIPVRDTLKRQDPDHRIEATVEREGLWAAQTPQLFRLEALLAALREALQAGAEPTDEAAAMERAGARPTLVMGSASNIKITWPQDLAVAEAWLTAHAMAE